MVDTTRGSELRMISRIVAPVREQLLQMMREAIVTGEWKPGQRLVERELCERTGASRSSVREALRQLESEGLVTVVPNRGPIVSTLSEQEVKDIYELRIVLDSFMIQRFCEVASDEEIAEVRDCFAEIEATVAAEDIVGTLHATTRMHDLFLIGAGNTALSATLNRLGSLIAFLRARSQSDPRSLPEVLEENRKVFEAAASRNSKAATRAMEHHIKAACKRAVATFD